MPHIHRPSFVGFLFSKPRPQKGARFRVYCCKKCGKRLQIVSAQRGINDLLIVIPAVLALPFMLLPDPHWSAKNAVLYLGLYLLLVILSFFVVYRFAKFKVDTSPSKGTQGTVNAKKGTVRPSRNTRGRLMRKKKG